MFACQSRGRSDDRPARPRAAGYGRSERIVVLFGVLTKIERVALLPQAEAKGKACFGQLGIVGPNERAVQTIVARGRDLASSRRTGRRGSVNRIAAGNRRGPRVCARRAL
jgi:hypothetical protein